MGKWSKTEESWNTSSHPDNKKQRQETPTQERMWEQKVTVVQSFLLYVHALCANVCVYVRGHTHATGHAWSSEDNFWERFSPTTGTVRTELRSSGLLASTFT